MSQKDFAIGYATTPGVSSEGQHAAHLSMELEYNNQVVWVAVLASSDGMMPDGGAASQYVVSQIYNGLTQSAQPIAARLRESIYRANLELIGAAGATSNVERPLVSVLVVAVTNNILHAAYVGNIVAHLWQDGVTFPLTANHPQYASNAARLGINNQERLGRYPDMPIHGTLVEQMIRSDMPPMAQERFRMCDFLALKKESLLVLSPKEIDSNDIGDAIVRNGSSADPNVLANNLVMSPTIVGSADDVTAIVLRAPEQITRKVAVSGRLISALFGFVLFAGTFGGLLFAFPELSNRLRITAPSTPIVDPLIADASGTDTEQGNAVGSATTVAEVATETATSLPSATPEATATPTAKVVTATESPTETESPNAEEVEEDEPDLSLTVNINAEDIVALAPTVVLTETTTETPSSTSTLAPTASPTEEATETSTSTSVPTETPTEAPTEAPTETVTETPTSSPTATASSTPSPTATTTFTPLPTATALPTDTPTPRPTATKPTSDIKSLQLVSPPDNTQSGGRQKFEWTFWGTLAPGQKFEVIFWEEGHDALKDGFGIAGATSNTRLSVDLDRLNRQLPLFRGGVTYQWGVLLVTENPYSRLALLSGARTFIYSDQSGSSAPDKAGE